MSDHPHFEMCSTEKQFICITSVELLIIIITSNYVQYQEKILIHTFEVFWRYWISVILLSTDPTIPRCAAAWRSPEHPEWHRSPGWGCCWHSEDHQWGHPTHLHPNKAPLDRCEWEQPHPRVTDCPWGRDPFSGGQTDHSTRWWSEGSHCRGQATGCVSHGLWHHQDGHTGSECCK